MALLSALPRHCKHQVFPSFHGPDVRRGFLSCLLKEFREKGIDVFIDNDIERSKSIGPELREAIRGSLIAVVLISKNYASSTWCLNELVEIMKCRDEVKQTVMVVFYELEPSDVKKQNGDFGAIFERTCEKKTTEEVERWRKALQGVAQIAGYHSSNYDNDAAMIETIANNVSNKFNDSTASNDFDGFVGVGTHIREIESLLSLQSDEVRMVGIWGPAGIGKTTIARALYRKLSSKFTHTAFIESIKGKFEQNYRDEHAFMLHLQAQLLSETLNQKDLKIDHLGVAETRLKDKKVLLVLDDVDELKQLEAMINKNCWFGRESRIIITTKDKKLLRAYEINHIYQVDFPSASEALEILCLSAFRQNRPSFGFEDMAMEVTQLAGNLPLGLRVFGAYLRGMSIDQWIHALPRLRTSLDGDIEKVLRFSYDALCDEDQKLFLHIACFFKDGCISDVLDCLADSVLMVKHGLQVLFDKSFISIRDEEYLMMHNLLEHMGKEIVRRQAVSEPGKRQFLVDSREICDVLTDNEGTETILGIDLDLSEIREEIAIDERAFEGMPRLKFLRFRERGSYINTKLLLPQSLKFRANKLRFLEWDRYPFTCFPREFHPQRLVKLEMEDSRLEKLWDGAIPLPCLKSMILTGSFNLKELPDLSNATNLEVLEAGFCISLVEVPSSIGKATSLQRLQLYHCDNLMSIPSSIGNATNLQMMNLQGCCRLVELPSSIGRLKRLESLLITRCSKLDYRGSRLRSFPDISTNIRELNLSYTTIEEVPSLIMSWTRLHTLRMSGCQGLKLFPDVPDRIRELDLSGTGIEEVPPSIKNLSRLTELSMSSCKKLKVLPTDIDLESLSSLDLSHCTQLKTFPEISTSIKDLDLKGTAIEEVPSSVWSWFRLIELRLDDCHSLHVLHIVPDSIQEVDFSNTETNFLGGDLETDQVNINNGPLPLRINLNGCNNLESLPQLPNFISFLDAAGCESLERIQGSFLNPEICLSFANCFRLSQEARELIQATDCKFALLPGEKLPADFDHRARGGSVTVNLDQRPLPLFLRFKACLLLSQGIYTDNGEVDHSTGAKMLSCHIWCVHKGEEIGYGSCKYYLPALLGFTEHLYFFQSSISLNFHETDVNFNELEPEPELELEFEFKISGEYWGMKACGVRLLEDPGDHEYCGNDCNETEFKECADIKITRNLHAGTMITSDHSRYQSFVGEVYQDWRRELGAFGLAGFLCIGILIYNRLEKFLILLLPIFVYGISILSARCLPPWSLCSQVKESENRENMWVFF